MTGKTYNFTQISQYYWIIGELGKNIKKTNIKNDVCLHSEFLDIPCKNESIVLYPKSQLLLNHVRLGDRSFGRLV